MVGLGVWPGSDPGWRKQGEDGSCSLWGGEGVASYWLPSRLQDSDGDKSDDLVVDVSNEVRADPGCRVPSVWEV